MSSLTRSIRGLLIRGDHVVSADNSVRQANIHTLRTPSGGIDGELLPLASSNARFNDTFNSLDLRLSRTFPIGRLRIDGLVEMFNVFNVTNILGIVNRELLRLRQRAGPRF